MTLSNPAERHQRIKQLFLEACRQEPGDRSAFLDQACGDDVELRREVQELLAHHQPGSSFLDPVLEPGVLADATVFFRGAAKDKGPGLSDSSVTAESIDQGRFEPGTIINDRYRITGLLGRGGMGDVYRADDLTLAQAVALKFLPLRLKSDTRWLDRFHNEVRMARQIGHPNVCRVYDVGYCTSVSAITRTGDSSRDVMKSDPESRHIESAENGQVFISMEFVDGEDLASLLRRIGRLPKDKAIQIARQLCAGLSAAHYKGVLHRDLKPTNVMIDGRGQVRITDFGLASPTSGLSGLEIRAGTPAYMAPEQLAGREVSIRSDIYALGLVLFEMFTGKPAFKGQNAREYERLHSQSTPPNPSHLVDDMDDAVSRVILRCLEKDPKHRPSSALAVMAALPGGDPLAAALAAGETPSPEMVAAAGGSGVIEPQRGLILLALTLIGIALVVVLASQVTLVNKVPLPKSPEVLAADAQNIIRKLGYSTDSMYSVYGFSGNQPLLDWIETLDEDDTSKRWDRLTLGKPASVNFWYRQSPTPLTPLNRAKRATLLDPPATTPGMTTVVLDPHGRLLEFYTMPQLPPGQSYSPDAGPEPNWQAAFELAGLNFNAFLRPNDPKRLPPVFATRRSTWIGQYVFDSEAERQNATTNDGASGTSAASGDDLEERVRRVVLEVDAAGYNGRIVYFSLMPPWRIQAAMSESLDPDIIAPRGTVPRREQLTQKVQAGLFVVGIVFASVLAWRNLKTGRGDRRGAVRVALFIFAASMMEVLLGATHVPQFLAELNLFGAASGHALYRAAQIWLLYLALEPFVRRVWPETIISWSRLLTGRFNDPLIGRDVLIGGTFTVWALIALWLAHLLPGWLSPFAQGWNVWIETNVTANLAQLFVISPSQPGFESTEELMRLMGSRLALSRFAEMQFMATFLPLLYLMVLLLLRMTVRKHWLIITIFVMVVSWSTLFGPNVLIRLPIVIAVAAMMTHVLIRHGLMALIAGTMIYMLLTNFPLTPDVSAWYALPGYLAAATAALLVVYGFYISQGGRPLIREEML